MKRRDKYILIDREPVPCDDLIMWAVWFERFDPVIANDVVSGMYEVSTSFLGLDMNLPAFLRDDPTDDARPLLFETVVFRLGARGERRGTQTADRWHTYDDAEQKHAEIVESLRRSERG